MALVAGEAVAVASGKMFTGDGTGEGGDDGRGGEDEPVGTGYGGSGPRVWEVGNTNGDGNTCSSDDDNANTW